MFRRLLKPTETASFFLFGARGTGKSTLLDVLFPRAKHLWIDLLETREERIFRRNPDRILDIAKATKKKIIVIDEVQKLPALLDPIHKAIETYKTQFVLTGSSARKLKRGSANLLAGRAYIYHLFPLSFIELDKRFDLQFALEWGSLPKIFHLSGPQADASEFLDAYTQTYLKEEVFAEQLVRDVSPFKDFIEIAAFENGHILNFEKLAREVGVDGKTIATYFQILQDTMVGFLVESYHRSIRKRQKLKPKFYFFDTGVVRSLQQTLASPLIPRTSAYGAAFEHFVVLEIFRLNSYTRKNYKIFFIEINEGGEIDIVLEKGRRELILIEIKSKDAVSPRDLRHLLSLGREFSGARKFLLSLDKVAREEDGISIREWSEGLREIFLRA